MLYSEIMKEAVLEWGTEVLQISGGVIRPTAEYGDTVTLPDQAEVIVLESVPNWGGLKGITHFVSQTPDVHLSGVRGMRWRQEPFEMDFDALFGRMCSIDPDGTYWPPQLPAILEHVEKEWGWKIDQRVKDLVAAGHPCR